MDRFGLRASMICEGIVAAGIALVIPRSGGSHAPKSIIGQSVRVMVGAER
jgi:hypothetical protein